MLLRRLFVAQHRIHHCKQDVGGANITRSATLELERQLGFLGSLFILVLAPQKPGAFQMRRTVRRRSLRRFVQNVPRIFSAPLLLEEASEVQSSGSIELLQSTVRFQSLPKKVLGLFHMVRPVH